MSINEHILPFPDSLLGENRDRIEMRVQEDIYGHRFISDQDPYMILLEVLAVCAEVPLGTENASPKLHEQISYDLKHRRRMRYVVFSDRNLERVLGDSTISDRTKWKKWKDITTREYNERLSDPTGFDYLDSPFDNNLKSLYQVAQILHSYELDAPNNRRSSSKFLSIKGQDMICCDMRETKGSWSPDRRFFGRGGELVYLMLNRSCYKNELNDLVQDRFLKTGNWVNRAAQEISNDPKDGSSRTHIGYLPVYDHDIYDQIAADWHSILRIEDAPSSFLFDPLFRITSLNLIEYFFRRSTEVSMGKEIAPIFVDVTNGSNSRVRDLSKNVLSSQKKSLGNTVVEYINRKLESCSDWSAVHNNGSEAKKVLSKLFGWESESKLDPESQLQALISKATSRSSNNIQKCFLPLVKGIGIAGTRPGIGPWFNISDQMISALVLANVSGTCELTDFTKKLYKKYRIVIGPEEARKAFKKLPIGIQCFEKNLIALENRMRRLSLSKRLSDDCAFVTPWWGKGES